MKEAVIILPHQLFKDNPCLGKDRIVYLAELDYFFNRFPFHKQKIALHYASMSYYHDYLKKQGLKVLYCPHTKIPTLEKLIERMKRDGIRAICCTEMIEHDLQEELQRAVKKYKISCALYKSPLFLSSEKLLASIFKRNVKRFVMGHFYRKQRQELKILVDKHGEPIGGQWSFDEFNREPLPEHIKIPKPYRPRVNKYSKAAVEYVNRFYKNNPGELDLRYPVTHAQAESALTNFLKHRLYHFGPYQDALSQQSSVLFHSQLSLLLNNGLLTPHHVIKKTLDYAKKHKIPLNSLEGFIRQIIGWREFVYGMYRYHGKKQKKSNFWKNKNRLSTAWWHGTTNIDPVDQVIKLVIESAYAHHIERLMILGNVMLLCEVNPNEVYRWFMELFIDSYDWVMVPNVYGMSQFADGGLMATKPYISSSAYIQKMGAYKKGDWEDIWDGLFWHFIYKHRNVLKKNARLARTVSLLKRIKESTLKKYLRDASVYLKSQR